MFVVVRTGELAAAAIVLQYGSVDCLFRVRAQLDVEKERCVLLVGEKQKTETAPRTLGMQPSRC